MYDVNSNKCQINVVDEGKLLQFHTTNRQWGNDYNTKTQRERLWFINTNRERGGCYNFLILRQRRTDFIFEIPIKTKRNNFIFFLNTRGQSLTNYISLLLISEVRMTTNSISLLN